MKPFGNLLIMSLILIVPVQERPLTYLLIANFINLAQLVYPTIGYFLSIPHFHGYIGICQYVSPN